MFATIISARTTIYISLLEKATLVPGSASGTAYSVLNACALSAGGAVLVGKPEQTGGFRPVLMRDFLTVTLPDRDATR